MIEKYLKDKDKLAEQMARFEVYVHHMDKKKGLDRDYISFASGFLKDTEIYKRRNVSKAQDVLNAEAWKERQIGTWKVIAPNAKKAIGEIGNLVNWNQKTHFEDILDEDKKDFNPDAERVLYGIYRGNDDELAFNEAVRVFGGKYDLIAALFFILNEREYMPMNSRNLQDGFNLMGIDYPLKKRCSWENYNGYLDILKDIKKIMLLLLPIKNPDEVALIDAQTFVWVIHDGLKNWNISKAEKGNIKEKTETNKRLLSREKEHSPVMREVIREETVRDSKVAKDTKQLAGGICGLCRRPAPFRDKKGEPYLECHHIEWLSRGGSDSLGNTVALCPNCHTKMHVVDDPEDVMKLKKLVQERDQFKN